MKGRIVVSFTGKLQANWQTAVMLHFTDLISLMRFPLCLTVLTHKYPPKNNNKRWFLINQQLFFQAFIEGQPGQSIVRVHHRVPTHGFR